MQPVETSPEQPDDQNQRLYLKNRFRFLRIVYAVLGLFVIALIVAGMVWYLQENKLAEQKRLLNEEREAIQQKHRQLETEKQQQPQ